MPAFLKLWKTTDFILEDRSLSVFCIALSLVSLEMPLNLVVTLCIQFSIIRNIVSVASNIRNKKSRRRHLLDVLI